MYNIKNFKFAHPCDMPTKGGCAHICVKDGSQYSCECGEGFELADDKKSCNSASSVLSATADFYAGSTKEKTAAEGVLVDGDKFIFYHDLSGGLRTLFLCDKQGNFIRGGYMMSSGGDRWKNSDNWSSTGDYYKIKNFKLIGG